MSELLHFLRELLQALLFGDRAFPPRLVLLAAAMVGLYASFGHEPDANERFAVERVRAAQDFLFETRCARGIASLPEIDPWQTGLIGSEMSEITTTLGDPAAKRTSCDPRWASRILRWYRAAGLQRGARVAILPSGSFPGFLLSALVAAERMDLQILLLPSLGASSWGANLPELPLLDLLSLLRSGGFLHTLPVACTLGGAGEIARDLSPEGKNVLLASAARNGVAILSADSFEELFRRKKSFVLAFSPDLVVQIGGSEANLGEDPAVLHVPPGLLRCARGGEYGNGLIVDFLRHGIPVLHLLSVRQLCAQSGIPFDAPPEGPRTMPRLAAVMGMAIFVLFLTTHRRWSLSEPDGKK